MAKTLMVQGTGSGVGKSVLVAALCRILWKDGRRVAPFKSQNMALNSFVTAEGLEMGRAQVMQAEACGLAPTVKMNPVLLKPSGDTRSQVVVMGRPVGEREAGKYYADRPELFRQMSEAFRALASEYEIIVLEGAGSPAEINLRHADMVNMAMAREARAPVLIVGDIDRGGVFAWMKGTYDLLDPEERRHVKGFLINKFRGDLSLLESGVRMFEEMVGLPVLGVIPFFRDIHLDEEDAVPVETLRPPCPEGGIDIAVIYFPHISNFTDFLALAREPDVSVRYVRSADRLGRPDLIVLPGTKNTIEDLLRIRSVGLEDAVLRRVQSGTPVAGICGGFQMLGRVIEDPERVESREGRVRGMDLVPMRTVMTSEKQTIQVSLSTAPNAFTPGGITVCGYEIHMGRTIVESELSPLFEPGAARSASVVAGDRILGTYVHGLFDSDAFRLHFLNGLRSRKGLEARPFSFDYRAFKQEQLDRLEAVVRGHLDMEAVLRILERGL
ncbi:MAG: cobyric acid synthase [bacterium]